MTALSIDPGTTHSAYVLATRVSQIPPLPGRLMILDKGKLSNDALHAMLPVFQDLGAAECVIEEIASYGMPVGREVFTTCIWIGRFMERFGAARCVLLPRLQVKLHLCFSPKANDAAIRARIIDLFGGPQAIKKGGPLYKVTADIWSSLALLMTRWNIGVE